MIHLVSLFKASGLHFHSLLRSLALLVCSFVLSFFLHWKLGLVYIGLFTILFLVSIFQAKVDKSVGKNEEKSLIDSVQVRCKCLITIVKMYLTYMLFFSDCR